jgi:hypothetical protein
MLLSSTKFQDAVLIAIFSFSEKFQTTTMSVILNHGFQTLLLKVSRINTLQLSLSSA